MNKPLYYFLPLLALVMLSCETEEADPKVTPEPEPEPVTFSIKFSGNKDVLHGQEQVNIESTELDKVSSVALYLGDHLMAADSTAPFEVSFSTEDFEDGKYQLKVIASSEGELTNTVSTEVTISNILLKLFAGPWYETMSQEGWAFLTDPQGNILGKAYKLQDEGEYVWRRPKGFTDTFTYNHFVVRLQQQGYKYYRWNTIQDYPTKVVDERMTETFPESLGSAIITVNNTSADPIFYYLGNKYIGHMAGSSEPTSISFSIPVFAEKEKLTMSYWSQQGGHDAESKNFSYAIIEASPGGNYEISKQDSKPATSRVLTFPSTSTHHTVESFWNIDNNNRFIGSTSNTSGGTAAALLPQPGDATLSYVGIYSDYEGGSFSKFIPYAEVGDVVNAPDHKAVITQADQNTYSATISGTADQVYDQWSKEEWGANTVLYYQNNYRRPEAAVSIRQAAFPDTLASLYAIETTWPVSLKIVKTTDYKNISGYEDFVTAVGDKMINTDLLISITGGQTSSTTVVPGEGGIQEKGQYSPLFTSGTNNKHEFTGFPFSNGKIK